MSDAKLNTISVNFDDIIERGNTACVKHDGRHAYFGTTDITPLWVADMDFAAPEAVTRALVERAQHPVYGYTFYPDSLYEALISWLQKRHNWSIKREWIMMTVGVVPSIHAAILAFTRVGEGVIIQPPVYFPFFSSVTTCERQLVVNPLRLIDGRYQFDIDHLTECAAQGAKLLLLCSPHNPVGRVWTVEELQQILAVARQYDLLILADEIHHDLVYPQQQHTLLATLASEQDNIITALAPSKTFNIAGLNLSALIVPKPEHRAALQKVFDSLHIGHSNPFSIAAFEAAYRDGEAWLTQLLVYLNDSKNVVRDYLIQHLPSIRLIEPEGTYLLWLDCRDLAMTDMELRDFFIHQAKVGMNAGTVFGEQGQGFMRLNIGSPRSVIIAALDRIVIALKAKND